MLPPVLLCIFDQTSAQHIATAGLPPTEAAFFPSPTELGSPLVAAERNREVFMVTTAKGLKTFIAVVVNSDSILHHHWTPQGDLQT